jgi:integrase
MTDDTTALIPGDDRAVATREVLAEAGQAANEAAARHVFDDYRSRKAANTIRRQDAGLALFAKYLAAFGVKVGDLAQDPEAWRGITWGLVEGFVKWQLAEGYSVGSVNVRLSTIRVYSKLAMKAGALDTEQAALIRAVQGYSHKEGKRIDEKREVTRLGAKKAEPVSLTPMQAEALKQDHPLNAQGRRDTVLMCLLLDHGLRASEAAALTVSNFDLKAGEMRFFRVKVDKWQTHKLTDDTWLALQNYMTADALAVGPLMRGSRKDGRLCGAGMNERNISERVKVLGERLGIEGLSAHDCRHYCATRLARQGKNIKDLMEIFGWKSTAMAERYIEDAKVIEVE